MDTTELVYLTLAEARGLIDRGLDKARDLGVAATIAVVDAGGRVVSLSRVDDAPLASLNHARLNAEAVAAQGGLLAAPDGEGNPSGSVVPAAKSMQDQTIHVWGAAQIVKGGRVVGGMAASDGREMGDDASFDAVEETTLGVGADGVVLILESALTALDPRTGVSPVRPCPLGLYEARHYADSAIERASVAGAPIGVAIVDELGRLIQMDRMDGSPLASGELAEAKAMTALKFRRASSTLTDEFRGHSARLEAIEKIVGFTLLAVGGGVPIFEDGRLVGAIGVSGSGASPGGGGETDEDIASAGIKAK